MRAPPPGLQPLGLPFFDRDPQVVAADLLGKVLGHWCGRRWLLAWLVETEAYYLDDKASHASLGYTEKRRALFMPPGTVYMYYARGGDSFNVSCRGAGNAVLIKAGLPYLDGPGARGMPAAMQMRNPLPSGTPREPGRLCTGQTLLCRSLGLKVPDWDGRAVTAPGLLLADAGYRPRQVVRARRLGIPQGRDGHLPYRFVDAGRAAHSTRNPLTQRGAGRVVEAFSPPQDARAWESLLRPQH